MNHFKSFWWRSGRKNIFGSIPEKWIRVTCDALMDGVYPQTCIVCHSLIFRSKRVDINNTQKCSFRKAHHLFFSEDLCEMCLKDISFISSPLCSICGKPFQSEVGEDHLCSSCIHSPPYFFKARSISPYEAPVRQMIRSVKYRSDISLAKRLGQWLFYHLLENSSFSFDFVIPVPLHIKRMRQRGFNQSYILIKFFPKLYEVFMSKPAPFIISDSALTRKRHTPPQKGLGRKERLKNVEKAFCVPEPFILEGKRILLVDDVWTTGATVSECARMLILSGACSVEALTLARVV